MMQKNEDVSKARAPRANKPDLAQRRPSERPRVMIIEDSDLDRMICLRAIKKADLLAGCSAFDNAVDALDQLRDRRVPKPDLILLDINMPGMNGLEFLEHLGVNSVLSAQTSVLLMTGAPLPAQLRRRIARYRSCIGETEKPLTVGAIQSALETVQTLRDGAAAQARGA